MISLSVNFSPVFVPGLTKSDLTRIRIAVANEMRELVSDRFRQQGGNNFWKDAATRTRRVRNGDSEVIEVQKRGVRLQWLGLDPNKPKHAKLLALPASKAITEYPRAYSNLMPICTDAAAIKPAADDK